MSTTIIDHGIRCERHVGEAFRVRCADCDEAAAEYAAELEGLPPAHATRTVDRPREVRSLARAAGRVRD